LQSKRRPRSHPTIKSGSLVEGTIDVQARPETSMFRLARSDRPVPRPKASDCRLSCTTTQSCQVMESRPRIYMGHGRELDSYRNESTTRNYA
jgi:hypothetical protein